MFCLQWPSTIWVSQQDMSYETASTATRAPAVTSHDDDVRLGGLLPGLIDGIDQGQSPKN
jgi:hypothetical protein